MKVQGIVQQWLDSIAIPEMNARQTKIRDERMLQSGSVQLGISLLDPAREILQSVQDEERDS